uniref:DM10 domain-containing protein n=1 Tax=Periophthalmus magnuspinnatus TaxID=409849 RepID=A0A3B4AFH8_9GOBI
MYLSLFSQMEKSMNPLRPYERIDTRRQFLDNDSKVLRFYGYWDDSSSLFGDVRDLVLHYFLVDDTIEIREVIAPNCGRDHVSKFLRRSKLPKVRHYVITDTPVPLQTGAVKQEFYKDSDLTIGTELNVWGRRVTITDCDEFTKNYYRSKYGIVWFLDKLWPRIQDFTPVQYKAPAAPKPSRYVPPYNGFGSEEDSLSSCQGLVPKPPQKDFHKFMTKDSHVLNFEAKMVTENPVDKDRVFIISFYLRDDTISVFEKIQKNSGVLGGAFLQRGRVKKPGQDQSQRSQYFTAQDFYVGAVLCLNKRNFQLIEADEYTLNYMEQHADEVWTLVHMLYTVYIIYCVCDILCVLYITCLCWWRIKTRTICKSFSLPLPETLLTPLLQKYVSPTASTPSCI